MIKVVAKSEFQVAQIEKVITLYKELVEETRKEEGCISYELFQDEINASIITVIETWENKASLEAHFKTVHFTRIVPQLRELKQQEGEMNIYNILI